MEGTEYLNAGGKVVLTWWAKDASLRNKDPHNIIQFHAVKGVEIKVGDSIKGTMPPDGFENSIYEITEIIGKMDSKVSNYRKYKARTKWRTRKKSKKKS